MTYEVYKITNLLNNKTYIGVSVDGHLVRWNKHLSDARNGTKYRLYNAMRKYGVENFKIELIENCESIKEMKEREIHYIDFYGSYKFGYNMTKGGDGTWGRVFSDETKRKIGDKARRRQDPKSVHLNVLDKKGGLHKFNNILDAAIFIEVSRDWLGVKTKRDQICEINGFIIERFKNPDNLKPKCKEVRPRKTTLSKEVRTRIGITISENYKKYPERKEQARKSREKYSKTIAQINKETGEVIAIFTSARQAEELTGISRGSIRGYLKGSFNKGKGYVWKFIEKEVNLG